MQGAFYGKMDREKYDHVIDKWKGKEGDFFDFYLNTDDEIQRLILESLGIEVEPDKYMDYDSRITAQIVQGKKRNEIYPFETECLYQYLLYGYNHSLTSLKAIGNTFKVVSDNHIELYGNTENWSLFWVNASPEDRDFFLAYILENN